MSGNFVNLSDIPSDAHGSFTTFLSLSDALNYASTCKYIRDSTLSPIVDCHKTLLTKNEKGYNTLMIEAGKLVANTDKIRFLIRIGGRQVLLTQNNIGQTVLHIIVKRTFAHLDLLRLVCQDEYYGKEILSMTDCIGNSALHDAVNLGSRDVIDILCESLLHQQEVLMLQNYKGDTPLHLSVEAGDLEVTRLLCASTRREALQLKNNDGYTPILLAKKKFKFRIEAYLNDLITNAKRIDNLLIKLEIDDRERIKIVDVMKKEGFETTDDLLECFDGDDILDTLEFIVGHHVRKKEKMIIAKWISDNISDEGK